MTTEKIKENKQECKGFRVYIKPQSFSDCFIATMDPKDPFKICLYPSVKPQTSYNNIPIFTPEEEIDQLVLYNYLMLKQDILIELENEK